MNGNIINEFRADNEKIKELIEMLKEDNKNNKKLIEELKDEIKILREEKSINKYDKRFVIN